MLAPVTFLLPDGRQISPLQVAPWAHEPEADKLPGILRRLRGEWPCVPFGYSVPNDGFPVEWAELMEPAPPGEDVHGHAANHEWHWEASTAGNLRLSIDYPPMNSIRSLERIVTPDPAAAAIDLELHIHVRERCHLPIGLHPVFRLPAQPGAAKLEAGQFGHGRTYPGSVESGVALFTSNARFERLTLVPSRRGSPIDASSLPFRTDTEELLQLNGVDGTAALVNLAEGYRVRLRWQAEHFPSLLLWFSNRGRKMSPWNGRHLAIGIEPVCSPFGLSATTAIAHNPIAASGTPTAHAFAPDEPFVTRYRIEVEAA
jgi:hypothetical protein